ncbi:hypothetical protein [Winogradskyella sp. PE311]|uniref:hypothetical protein n=1 Tax=Winogradskyella sp. PE311 TaxID=3366943 RepID=UPI00397F6E68
MTETLEQNVIKTEQKVNLVEGKFTPSEASHVVNALIEQKINFHKVQRLRMCEGFEDSDTSYMNGRVKELMNEKQIAKDYINIARREGYDVIINGTLEITFTKK